jgi:regulator of RNase E activity RraA
MFEQETQMRNRSHLLKMSVKLLLLAGVVFLALAGERGRSQNPRPAAALTSAGMSAQQSILQEYRQVEIASISDAEEQLYGRRMYMSHRMRPIFATKFVGYAVTVLLKKQENHQGGAAMSGMLAAIDHGEPNDVFVMKVQYGSNIAGMGGEMGTAMAVRGFVGAVIDGGTRDTAYLRKIQFPVYSLGIVPSTSINHYVFGGSNIPIVCDGVPVAPGDIVAADSDGVVVVPRADAEQVLKKAQQLDFAEHTMYPYITKYKSIGEAVKKFGRL